MVVKKEKITVMKVPDKNANDNSNIRQEFKAMPTMYLELVENKEKVKMEVMNKDFEPEIDMKSLDKSILEYPQVVSDYEDSGDEFHYSEPEPEPERSIEGPKIEVQLEKNDDDEESKYKYDYDKPRSASRYDDDKYDDYDKYDKYEDYDKPRSASRYDDDKYDDYDKYEDYDKPRSASRYDDDKYDDYRSEASNRLMQLLQSDGESDGDTKYNRRSYENFQKLRKDPPKLSDLTNNLYEKNEEIKVDIENEDEKKRELLFKFDLLRKSYPNEDIPEFSIHSDYQTMKIAHESCLKRITVEGNVDKYKTYLIGGFMVVEYIMGRYIGFDMEGYCQSQISNMNSYDRLLIELGEKQYIPEDQQWPVEVRLIFLIIVNTCVFLMGKMIMQRTGADLMGMINNMNLANKAPPPGTNAPPPQKKKMQGPNINLDDL